MRGGGATGALPGHPEQRKSSPDFNEYRTQDRYAKKDPSVATARALGLPIRDRALIFALADNFETGHRSRRRPEARTSLRSRTPTGIVRGCRNIPK